MYVADGGHDGFCCQCCCPRSFRSLRPRTQWWCLWSKLATTGGLWMSAVPVANRDHIGAYGLYCYLRSYWYLWSFYTWGTNRCLWPDLPPEAMSMSVIHNVPKTMLMSTVHAVARYHVDVYGLCDVDVCSHASSRGHVDVHDPFYHQRPCWCP